MNKRITILLLTFFATLLIAFFSYKLNFSDDDKVKEECSKCCLKINNLDGSNACMQICKYWSTELMAKSNDVSSRCDEFMRGKGR